MVTIIQSIQSTYTYISTKNKIIEEMKYNSNFTGSFLQKNIVDLISSYSVNEYGKLVSNMVSHRDTFAIIVEDYNMGKILNKKAYVSGSIRDANWNIIDYDSENNEQTKQLEASFYSEKYTITSYSGENLGSINIYISNRSMLIELNQIIIETFINTVVISLLLALSLFIAIRLFVLKPVSNIIEVISNCDDDGIPYESIKGHASAEISTLSNTINNMVQTIRNSRITLTEQHNELKAHEDQLRTLSMATEQSPVSILICDPANLIEYVNPQFEKTSGFDLNEVVGSSLEPLLLVNEKEKIQVAELKDALKSGKKWIGELTTKTKEGKHRAMRMSSSPILLEDGSVSHNIYVAEDITDQKKNEEILRNSQKMDAVGQLTGGIAHDFNNLLGVIMGNLELLRLKLSDKPEELKRIDSALTGTMRGAQLTRKLLNFSRQSHNGQEITYINSFIEDLYELIAKSVTAKIQVETHLEKNLWPVKIEPGDLEDAILNLSLNARDAMPKGGMLVIETANKYLDAKYVSNNPNINEGDYVMISISDTGTGISEETRKKIFDPFYTTKAFGKGTGLGLSMVYGFVQRSKGHIQLYSEEGRGSSFRIYLPRTTDEQDEQIYEDHEQVEQLGGDETILIVDDEVALSRAAKEYLQILGYHTLEANSTKEALNILSTNDSIDLIFSDVVMPGADGFELSFAAVKQKPSIKILLTSGFSSKHMEYANGEQQIYLKLADNLLGKPYNLNELAAAVRHTLDEQGIL